MDVVDLSPQLQMLRFPVGQAYLWRDSDSLTLIDTGVAGSGTSIEAAIRTLGLVPEDLDRVIITHFHDDHAGAAAEVGAWDKVTVMAHRLDAPIIRGQVTGPPPNFTEEEAAWHAAIVGDGLPPTPAARVDVELDEADVVPFGGGAQVLSVPGHTDGSLALFLPSNGVLFTGDTIASADDRVILGPFNLDRRQAMRSFRRLSELDSEMALFGHGDPVPARAADALRGAATHLLDDLA